jgi:hypothetical protein
MWHDINIGECGNFLKNFWNYSVQRKKKLFFWTLPGKVSSLWLLLASKTWTTQSGASSDSLCVECKVVVEKTLEVRERYSVVKTFFVIEGVRNIGIVVAILALFFFLSKFHKMKIPAVSTKSSTWAWGTKSFKNKKLKSIRDMLKWWNFIRNLGGESKEGVVHGPNPCTHYIPLQQTPSQVPPQALLFHPLKTSNAGSLKTLFNLHLMPWISPAYSRIILTLNNLLYFVCNHLSYPLSIQKRVLKHCVC